MNSFLIKKRLLTEKKLFIFLTLVVTLSLLVMFYQLPSSGIMLSEDTESVILPKNGGKLKSTRKPPRPINLKNKVFNEREFQDAKLNKFRRNRIKEVNFDLDIC
jgi:hypothetical protein